MKKVIFILLIVLVITTACRGDEVPDIPDGNEEPNIDEEPNVGETKEYKVEDFFPFKANTLFSYIGEGNEFAEQKTYFDFLEDNRGQLRTRTPGTDIIEILEIADGELRVVGSRGEFYNIGKFIDNYDSVLEVLIKEPIEVGTSWTLADGRERSISGLDVEIETPYKKFNALEITTKASDGSLVYDYYARNQGHVATIFIADEYEVKTLLDTVEENASFDFNVRFFYPKNVDEKIFFVNKAIEFRTNDSIEKIFEDNFKEPPAEDLRHLISQNTKINSIELDEENEIVNVDFSEELVTEMNAGSYFELLIINSIVNTLGNNYYVNKVYISVEGKPYSSGHIQLNEGEYFTVDMENIAEYE